MVLFLRARMGIASAENRLEKSPQKPRCQPSSGSSESVLATFASWVCVPFRDGFFYLSEVRKSSGAEKKRPWKKMKSNGEQPATFAS